MPLPPGFVNAKWVGVDSQLPDGTSLVSGETVVPIPKGEAEASDYWQPLGGKSARDEKKADAPAPDGGDS